MKTLPPRPAFRSCLCVLCSLCVVTALALAFPVPPVQATDLHIYGGGGGGGSGGGGGGGGEGGSAGAGFGGEGGGASPGSGGGGGGGGADGAGEYSYGWQGGLGGAGLPYGGAGGQGGDGSGSSFGKGSAGGAVDFIDKDANYTNVVVAGGNGGGGGNGGSTGSSVKSSGGAGGAGGAATVRLSGNNLSLDTLNLSGGDGGDGGVNGNGKPGGVGGTGGAATVELNNLSLGTLNLSGGNGGDGSDGGDGSTGPVDVVGSDGGTGGASSLTLSGDNLSFGTLNVSGGTGGDGGYGGYGGYSKPGGTGGAGSAASLTLKGNNLSLDALNIRGGNKGQLGGGANGGSGGDGGTSSVKLEGDNISIISLDIQSGTKNPENTTGQGGAAVVEAQNLAVETFSLKAGDPTDPQLEGGEASFTADTLKTGNISLRAINGDASFTLNKALVWTGAGAFEVEKSPNNTTGVMDITIKSLTIDGGTVNSGNYDNLIAPQSFSYGTSTITLGDKGATFDTTGGDQTVDRTLIGNGGLTKDGAGTLTLTGSNTYGGDTTINVGTLKGNIAANTDLTIDFGAKYDGAGKARSVSALNGEGTISKTNGLTVQSGTFGGVIDSSNRKLWKDGVGTLILSGENTYTGGTTISAGTLEIGNGGITGSIAGDITNNAALAFNRSDALTYGGIISGTGSLTKDGAGTLTLTGANAYTGDTTIKAGTLKGNIADNTDLSIALGAKYDGAGKARSLSALNGEGNVFNTKGLTVQSGLFGGVIDSSNTGGLTKAGTGTLELTGTNTYTGGTTITGGTLKGFIARDTDLSIALGAKYDGAGNTRFLSALNGKGTISNTYSLIVQSGTFGGVIDSSNRKLWKDGVGTLILSGENTYTGGTIIEGGTLQIGDGGTSGSVKGLIDNRAVLIFNRSNDVTHDGIIVGKGTLTKEGAGTLTLTGENTYTGGTFINAGTLRIGNGGTSGSIKGDIENHTALIFNRSDNLSHDGIISGTGTLTKEGAGTLTLTGANAYTGATTIQGGTLALSGGGTLGASTLLDLRGGGLDISGMTPASLSLPDVDVRGMAGLNVGDKTADLSGKTLSFYVPSDMGAGGTLLSVGGAGTTDISNSTVRVGVAGSSSALGAGDAVTLIDASGGTLQGDPANASSKGEGMQGVTLRYQFDLAKLGNRLTATVAGSPQVDPRSKALAEGFLGGMALTLQGADLAAGRGMESAVRASSDAAASAGGYGFAGFGALSGGSLRYNTGSHVDMDSLSMLTGLAWGVDLAPGRLTLGAFFEYGNGSYDTYNFFGNAASVHGDGDTHYLGGGILARMDFAPAGPGTFYAEASGRAGKTHNDYGSSDLRDAAGRKADYDSASPYYGVHVGTGYVWSLNESASLDLYGKYFWTRQEGDGVGLSTGEDLRFDDVDSSRVRLGGRFAYTVNEYVAPYIGAAWEHEFDGKARATSNGFDMDAPDLRGDTGIGEVGLSLTPSADLPLTVDLGMQGYTGKREGVTGNLRVKWEF